MTLTSKFFSDIVFFITVILSIILTRIVTTRFH